MTRLLRLASTAAAWALFMVTHRLEERSRERRYAPVETERAP